MIMITNRFFKNINVDHLLTSSVSAAASSSNTTKLFTSTKTKELLAKAREFIEKRMNDEQKAVCLLTHKLIRKLILINLIFIKQLNKLKRQSQAESKILSEEEIRKRRKEKKVFFYIYSRQETNMLSPEGFRIVSFI